MDSFCGSTFWDLNVTWYTNTPDLTPCFERTVLVGIPSGFLWICAGFEIRRALRRRKTSLPKSFIHIFILLLILLLFTLSTVSFVGSFINGNSPNKVYPVEWVAPLVQAATFAMVVLVQILNKQRGITKSGVLFLFWFLSVCCGVFEFQTTLRNPPKDKVGLNFLTTTARFPIVVLTFSLQIISDSVTPSTPQGQQEINKPCTKDSASFISLLTYGWVWPLLRLGYKKPLEFPDLWKLSPENETQKIVEEFSKHWKPALAKCQEANRNSRSMIETAGDTENLLPVDGARKNVASIIPSLWKANWKGFLLASFLKLVSTLLIFVTPKLLDLLINHVNSNEEMWKGFFYAFLMWLTRSLDILLQEHYNFWVAMVGYRTRSALTCAVYEKSLILSNSSRKVTTTGEMVNLMSTDSQKINDLMMFVNQLWCSPLQITLALYFLYQLLGLATFAGLGVLLVLVPLHIWLGNWRKKLQIDQMKNKDERVKLTNEIMAGIKVLKFYAWEPSFEKSVETIRRKELNILKKEAYVDSFVEFVFYTAPFVVTLSIFATYVLIDDKNVLDARKAFVALNLLNLMKYPLTYLPHTVILAIKTKVSVERLNKFLNADEIDLNSVYRHSQLNGAAITVEDGLFYWDETPVLHNINIRVQRGSLVAIVGVVGSGKSSLLSAILGEMEKRRGRVNASGSIAYVAQQAWIQNDTVQGNVLFGRDYNFESYNNVIQACALQPDLDILPAGDKTEIGEKGINLSGGQKQRVALARAIYNSADVYLLDDPLSAVDSHVSKHIFEEVIGPNGILRGKTRVLVTHGLTYLPQVDCIFVMKNGEISEVGTFQELSQKKGAFADYLAEYLRCEDTDTGDIDGKSESASTSAEKLHGLTTKIRKNLTEESPQEGKVSDGTNDEAPPKVENRLIEQETTETGKVRMTVYLTYLKNVGWIGSILIIFFHFQVHVLTFLSNVWLSKWTSESGNNGTEPVSVSTRDFYLGIYGGIGLGQAISVYLSTLFLVLGGIRASKLLHQKMLRQILRSPMSFFDTTPLGRILNRFSKDIDIVDNNFPSFAGYYLNLCFEILVTFVAIIYSSPLFSALVIPTGIFYYFIQNFFIYTSRQLKRLQSVLQSPVFSHFSETLAGVATIRAFSVQSSFITEAEKQMDCFQMACFSTIATNRWLGVQVQSLGNVITFSAAMFAVIYSPPAGIVGLSLTYALSITDSFYWFVRLRSEVESNLVSIERLKEYGEIQEEAAWENPGETPPKDWPQRGKIVFNNFQTRYREGLDLVLKNISCVINPGEKVGIVGRTGAGKSSMALGLFRIIEAAGGFIEIDGINISKLGLHDVRGKLTIIPQDPILFGGTLRMNLDPFQKYSDSKVWSALDSANLSEVARSSSAGLLHVISEGGENLSQGQRQLVCLARALLRKSKILILDEATAAVDMETDDLIQQTIRQEFQDCTILTIAHRINTIMDYDRVMVLDKGEIREYSDPRLLLQDSSSFFFQMAKNAGLV